MSNKSKIIEQMNDFDKLVLYRTIIQALNSEIRKKFDDKFVDFEPLITVTIAVNSGEILPYLLSFPGGTSMVSASLGGLLTEWDGYKTNTNSKKIDLIRSKMEPKATTFDEVLFMSGIMIFTNCIYPIPFLDLLPINQKNVKDNFSLTYLSSLEDIILDLDVWQLTNLLGFLRGTFPKNKETINFVSGIISEISLEDSEEAFLDSPSFDIGKDIFDSARKK